MRIFSLSFIISTLLIPFVANGNESDSELVKLESRSLCNALAMFKMDQRHWPTTEEGLNVLTFPALNDYGESGKPYLGIIKKDPWGNDYIYAQSKKRFKLISMGKDGVLNSPDDIGPNICYPDWAE
jgi:general secretion pathway protein G